MAPKKAVSSDKPAPVCFESPLQRECSRLRKEVTQGNQEIAALQQEILLLKEQVKQLTEAPAAAQQPVQSKKCQQEPQVMSRSWILEGLLVDDHRRLQTSGLEGACTTSIQHSGVGWSQWEDGLRNGAETSTWCRHPRMKSSTTGRGK